MDRVTPEFVWKNTRRGVRRVISRSQITVQNEKVSDCYQSS